MGTFGCVRVARHSLGSVGDRNRDGLSAVVVDMAVRSPHRHGGLGVAGVEDEILLVVVAVLFARAAPGVA